MGDKDVPEAFIELGPELLIHGDWSKLPPPEPPPLERAMRQVQSWLADKPWKRWSALDWLYALTFASIIVGITAECVRMYRMFHVEPS